MRLSEVVGEIRHWIRTIQEKHKGEIKIEFLAENEDFLRYILESANYLAELIVKPEGFHPYRFVSFTALEKTKDARLQKEYYYFDEEDSALKNILENLNKGIRYILR